MLPFLLVAWWIGLAFVTLGWGLLLGRARSFPIWAIFWSGLALECAVLPCWHLLLPADGTCLATIVAIGCIGLWRGRQRLTGWRVSHWLLGLSAAAIVGLGVALHALAPTQTYDTGLYHLATVQWNSAHPVVPGLGNLHGRLAFNQSYFLLAAALDWWPWPARAQHVLNGFVGWALLLTCAGAVLQLLRPGGDPSRHATRLLALMTAPAALFLAGHLQISTNYLSGLGPEIVLFAAGVAFLALLLHVVTGEWRPLPDYEEGWRRLLALAAGGVTIKLSLAAGVAAGMLVAALHRRLARPEPLAHREIRLTLGLTLLLLGPWVVHGVVLSGYPAYPSSFGAWPVDWRVPRVLVDNEFEWIRSWARQPGVSWVSTWGSYAWLPEWWSRFPKAVSFSLAMAVGGLGLWLLGLCLRRPASPGAAQAWIGFLPLPGWLGFWFLSAPDPRFAGAAFWLLAGSTVNAGLARWEPARPTWRWGCAALLASLVPWLGLQKGSWTPPQWAGWPRTFPALPSSVDQPRTTASGLVIHTPRDRALGIDQCWRMPLPATPYFRPDLDLRTGELAGGFRVQRANAFVDNDLPSFAALSTDPLLAVRVLWGWDKIDSATGQGWLAKGSGLVVHADQPGTLLLRITCAESDPPIENGGPVQWRVRHRRGGPMAEAAAAPNGTALLALPVRRGFNVLDLEATSALGQRFRIAALRATLSAKP